MEEITTNPESICQQFRKFLNIFLYFLMCSFVPVTPVFHIKLL